MDEEASSEALTLLLKRWSAGDTVALAELTPLVYSQLRILAGGYMRRERADHTLEPTALIHEAYVRLIDQNQPFENRRQFYGVAAHLMRMILVDHARLHRAGKRGSGALKLSIEDVELTNQQRGVDLLALDEALEKLAEFDERKARAIELRYFAGMSVEETAALLDISVATVRRELRFAENWLCRRLTNI